MGREKSLTVIPGSHQEARLGMTEAMVFHITEGVTDRMASEQLEIIFEHGSLGPEVALARIDAVFKGHGISAGAFDSIRILKRLQKAGRRHFDIRGHGFEFLLGSLPKFKLDFFLIKSIASPFVSWDDWAAEFVTSPDFVMAWVSDVEYDHWQNAQDPLNYEAVHKSFAHLPMRSNGLPPPLEQMVIDTSKNPGRWSFRNGYKEAVGATMWLGSSFWSLTGADREHLKVVAWLEVSNPSPSITRIQAAESCFTTDEGVIGSVQYDLRSLLFPGSAIHGNLH